MRGGEIGGCGGVERVEGKRKAEREGERWREGEGSGPETGPMQHA